MRQQRLARLAYAMQERGITQVIISEDRNLYYYLGQYEESMERLRILLVDDRAVVMPMSCLTFQQIQVLKLFDIAMEMSREPYGNWLRIWFEVGRSRLTRSGHPVFCWN